jgi:hypothetical protein
MGMTINIREYIALHCKREDYELYLPTTKSGAYNDTKENKIIARFAFADHFMKIMDWDKNEN